MKNYRLEFDKESAQLPAAIDDAADGEVVFLTRSGRVVAAIVPPEVAAAGMAALDAADQVADLALGESLIDDVHVGLNTIALGDLRAELG